MIRLISSPRKTATAWTHLFCILIPGPNLMLRSRAKRGVSKHGPHTTPVAHPSRRALCALLRMRLYLGEMPVRQLWAPATNYLGANL